MATQHCLEFLKKDWFKKLNRARLLLGWTERDLAKKSKLSTMAAHKVVKGKAVNLKTVFKAARALAVNMEDLIIEI
jgi:transcriptional regulator with XRE-family HTH domain